MIKNILYDYGYVLAYPRSGSWFIPANLKDIIGSGNMFKMIIQFYRLPSVMHKAHQRLDENHLLFTEEEELLQFIEYYSVFLEELGIKKGRMIMAELLARETVLSDDKVIFYDDVTEELQKAHTSYKTAILSDTWPSLKRLLDKQRISEHIDGLVMSCDYGICKDNVELFHTAIDKLDIIPGETVFVDDSQTNLVNAELAGLIPVLMDRRHKIRKSVFPVVHNLKEVYQFVEQKNKQQS